MNTIKVKDITSPISIADLSPDYQPEQSVQEVIKEAVIKGVRSFAQAYGARVALNSILHVLSRILSKKPQSVSLLRALFNIATKQEPFRFGAFMGGFTFLFKALYPLLPIASDRRRAFVAGSIAGLSLLMEEKNKTKFYGQQAAVRAVQSCYNAMKQRKMINLPYGDMVLFTFATAQILYAYVMHPATIPKEFYGFMLSSAKVPDIVLRQVASSALGTGIDSVKLGNFISSKFPKNSAALQALANPNYIGCEMIHPSSNLCTPYIANLWMHVFKQIIVVYLPLNIVPLVLLRSKALAKDPTSQLKRAVMSAARSSAFFAILVSAFQAQFCAVDKLYHPIGPLPALLTYNHRYLYYLFGLVSGSSIILESKSRRSELAMYVAPKAIESLYRVMVKRRWMIKVPLFQTVMNSCAFGALMAFYVSEPGAISPLFQRLFRHFLQ